MRRTKFGDRVFGVGMECRINDGSSLAASHAGPAPMNALERVGLGMSDEPSTICVDSELAPCPRLGLSGKSTSGSWAFSMSNSNTSKGGASESDSSSWAAKFAKYGLPQCKDTDVPA